jgi:hypothetical protein
MVKHCADPRNRDESTAESAEQMNRVKVRNWFGPATIYGLITDSGSPAGLDTAGSAPRIIIRLKEAACAN